MSKVYTNILNKDQLKIWEELSNFRDVGLLGGGTALALQINHRISYDFDVFSQNDIKKELLLKVANIFGESSVKPLIDNPDELSCEINSIKITFLYFPFKPLFKGIRTSSLALFSIKDIAANKAYAIGRRGTWRDYYDIYTILKNKYLSLEDLMELTEKKFKNIFNSKLFLEQLTYYKDISDFSIETKNSDPVSAIDIQKYLEGAVRNFLGL